MESETLDPDRVVIRPLAASDSQAYRRLRQHVLEIGEGKYFSSSYTSEQQFTSEDQWRARCAETAVQCTIGIFVDGGLVGVMRIAQCGDPGDLLTEWGSTWIEPRYRRSGMARQAYERVSAWSHERGYRYAVVDIRADNTRSREIRERQGAMYLCTQREAVWADGSRADVHYFLLSISPGTQRARSPEQAIAFLAAGQAFLRHEREHAATNGHDAGPAARA